MSSFTTNFINNRKIGEGQFGKVYYAYDDVNKRDVVLKFIKYSNSSRKDKKSFFDEIKISKDLDHKNIVKFYDCYKKKKYYVLAYEYCNGGTLGNYLKNIHEETDLQKKERQINYIMVQLKEALEYLYTKNVVHRDIKPDNILIHKENGEITIKICDFGFSKLYDFDDIDMFGNFKCEGTLCGTPIYMAPEILNNSSLSVKSDLWSLGIIMYELLYNSYPYTPKNFKELQNIIEKPIYYDKKYKYSTECLTLLKSLLIVNPSERISFENFVSNEWFNGEIYWSCVSNNSVISKSLFHKQEEKSKEKSEEKIKDLLESYVIVDDSKNISMIQTQYTGRNIFDYFLFVKKKIEI